MAVRTSNGRGLLLGTLLSSNGLHLAGWRHPKVDSVRSRSLKHYADMARLAEKGLLDFLFMADSLAVMYDSASDSQSRIAPLNDFEPVSLLSALAAVTENIGLIGSITTTYNEPFNIARQLASLDLLSEGRAGWNVVTSFNPAEAFNFGFDAHPPLPDRYARALESVSVAKQLWDSWQRDALKQDRESGIYFDPSKVKRIDHAGRFFKVRGPLTMPQPPQGHPLLVQSGSSELGRDAGVQFADLIFTAQQDFDVAKAFRLNVIDRAAKAGRSPHSVRVLPGIVPVIGRTEGEAQEIFASLQDLIHPDVGISLISSLLGDVDLSKYDIEDPLPNLPEFDTSQGRIKLLVDTARSENLSMRQLYQRVAGGARGHWTVVGSASQVADAIECWFVGGAADGFSIVPAFLPGSLESVVDLLIPELQQRGLFKTFYAQGNLRQKLALDVA